MTANAESTVTAGATVREAVAMNAEPPRLKLPTFKGKRLKLGRRPGSPDPEDVGLSRRWVGSQSRPWAVDLFAGAGGLSLGLRDAGINVIAAAEEDPVAAETHAANLGGLTWVGDLRDSSSFVCFLRERGIDQVDIVAGGPPCQPFSNAGLAKIRSLPRRQNDERTGLWRAFFGVIDELAPRVVLLENVPAFASMQEGAILAAFVGELEERGFNTQARVVEAWKYGVPQHRKRLFVVATREGESFRWPRPSRKVPTLRDAIGDLPVVGPGHREEVITRERRPSSPLARRLRKNLAETEIGTVTDHITREVRSDDAEIFALMRPGQTYADVPPAMRRYRADIFDDKYTRLSWDALSRSITAHIAKDGYWYIHPEQDRTLSVREAARIQTFPDWFRFAGHPSNRLRQIGNAVPPMLAAVPDIRQSCLIIFGRHARGAT
ncbi:MAG: DNA cytosine methyltransferase [Chloroflexi bacterium]|nr:DNA cytosine methyltransferase [Chloroflexota bacterium]